MSRPRRRRWGGALAITAALLLGAPVQAVAGNTYTVSGGSLVYGLAAGANGYRIHFSEWNRKRRRFKVVVDGHHAAVTYEVPAGRDPADGIAANLGGRGRFDLRLVRTGKPKGLGFPGYCEGRPGRWQRGYLLGTGRFRGEGDYTEAHFVRIPVIFESWPSIRCHYGEGGVLRGKPRRAHVFARGRNVRFGAVLFFRHPAPADRRAIFSAWMDGGTGRMRIYREVKVPAPESSFSFPGGPNLPEVMTVEPPRPFAGTATFSRSPESTFSWSGDLTVEFPGTAPIRLAGPSFIAGVCALDGCVHQEPEREPPT